jgi:glycerophosphoryl diester phosphodiesterase
VRLLRYALSAVAVAAVLLSLLNASWIAPKPPGRLTLVAYRGIGQQVDRAAAGSDACTARHIVPSEDNPYLENTLPAVFRANRMGADAIAIDVQRTRDGQMVAFADPTLECRTNGHGRIADHTLAELKRLDIAYGYTGDGGRTFPLRGRGIGFMPTVEQVLGEVQMRKLVFVFKSTDPADADALIAALARGGATLGERYSYYGAKPVIDRIRQRAPGAWAYGEEELGGCIGDYVKIGWTGYVPPACRGTTTAVPVRGQWKLWGWPYRFLARLQNAGTKVIMMEGHGPDGIKGLTTVEEYDDVPSEFRGTLWIDDFYTLGPALRR